MKKIIRNSRKAQSILEFVIIGAVVSVAAFVFLSPYADNIKSQFLNLAPQKSVDIAKPAAMLALFGQNSNKVLSSLSALQSSNDLNAKTFANDANNAISAVSAIKSGNSENVSDDALINIVNTLAKNSKENTSETSGSVASFISASSSDLKGNDATSAQDLITELKTQSISLKTEASLVSTANSLALEIKNEIASGRITKENLASMGANIDNLDTFFKQSYEISSDTAKPISNFVNTLNFADCLVKKGFGSSAISLKYSQLKTQTKKALK
ncbi:MAG: hypothetical protein WCK67_02370 [bacterium]